MQCSRRGDLRMQPWGLRFSLLGILLVGHTATGRSQEPVFERVVTLDGPSRGTIYSMLQDRYGFLWLGTATGLLRYDGYTFKRFAHNPSDTNSMSGDFVWSVCEDSTGDLWIGTSGRGLCHYVRDEGRFVRYRNIPNDTTSLIADEVSWVYVDRKNDVWAGSWNGGLNRFNRTNGTFTRYTNQQALPSTNVNRIFEDSSGRFWVGTRRGLALFNRVTGRSRIYRPDPKDLHSLPGEYIYAIYQSHDGSVWFGTDLGICRYNEAADNFTCIVVPGLANPAASLCEDSAGNLWVGTDGDGLFIIDLVRGGQAHFTVKPQDPDAISSNVILALSRDRTGILWLGTVATGLSKCDVHKRKFRHVITSPATVNALFEDSDGTLWIGTQDGVKRMPRGSSRVEEIGRNDRRLAPLRGEPVYAICEDRSGDLWFAKVGSGLYRFNKKTGDVQAFGLPSGPKDDTSPFLTSLFVDSRGDLWIGQSGGGVSRYDMKRKTFEHHARRTHPPFPADYVWVIHEDRRGYLWCGTWGIGAIRYDPRTGESLVFSKGDNRGEGKTITSTIVVSIAEGADGTLWFGTWGDGLNRYDPATGLFTRYSTGKGLPNDQIYGILVDDRTGELWLTTGYGLARFDPKTGTCITYDESDGVQSLEFRRGAVHRGKSGLMYAGGVNGFNMFRPEEIRGNGSIPPVELIRVQVLDREVPLPSGHLELFYNENFLSFEFAALDFVEPRKNQYAYQLEGLEHDWVNAGTRRFVSYANLSRGRYTFRVKGSNNDGVWNEQGATLSFSIDPPPWKTWWAFTLYGFVAVGAGVGWRRYEITKIRRKEREQAAVREAELRAELEKQRTRMQIARDLHDEVGSTLSSITFFAQAMSESHHSTDTESGNRFLSLIAESASHAKEAMSDIVWSINPSNDSWDTITSKLRRYASELFESKGIAHSIDIPPVPLSVNIDPQRRRHFWLLFKEIVINAVKHSRCTEVQVRLTVREGTVFLSVSDNGCGFDSNRPPQGHGLQNIESRARLLAATVGLQTSPGGGTRWEIAFPV
jgi:ligand-binding sensor domain-containing protein/signal transduction histidine kinase